MLKNKRAVKSFFLGILAGGILVGVVLCLMHPSFRSDKLPKLQSGQTPHEDSAVQNFFYYLSLGEYDMIIPEYAGLYELFYAWYPKLSPNDKYTTWKLVCERKDVYCLPVRDILSKSLLTDEEIYSGGTPEFIGYDDVYVYEVTYQNSDGSVFEMDPWSWTPGGEKIREFQVFVGRKGKQFFVLTPPPIHN